MLNNNQTTDRHVFTKFFESKLDFDRETTGYEFFSSYYKKLPKILERSGPTELCTVYEKIDSEHNKCVTDMLCKNQSVDLGETFNNLSSIANKYYQRRASTGGTQIFYIERADKLTSKQMVDKYTEYLNSYPGMLVNGRNVSVEKGLLLQLQERVRDFQYAVCIPSQGDIHERNMYTDGCIIDFEGSGWNHIATDVATFLWHTIFAGSHFGPLYAKWSTSVDKEQFKRQDPQINIDGQNIILQLNKARIDLVSQFLDRYVGSLVFLDNQILNDVCSAIAFRLISTFSPLHMNNGDRTIAFTLANLFYDVDLNLYDKLDILIK